MCETEQSQLASRPLVAWKSNVFPSRALSDIVVKALLPLATKADFKTYAQAASFVVGLAQISRFTSTSKAPDLSLAQAINQQYEAVSVHLPNLHGAYKFMCEAGHAEAYQRIWAVLLDDCEGQLLQSSIALPDLYLDLKEHFQPNEKNGGAELAKVMGQEYFRRTQFFTEPYMSNFLIEVALGRLSSPIALNDLPSLVDPACGAGNTLISAFESLNNRLEEKGAEDVSVADHVFAKIVGYDLDPVVASICKASLAIAYARTTSRLPLRAARILTDARESELGFFSPNVTRAVKDAIQDDRCVLITNPPFLGRRLMDAELKNYLKEEYRDARGDLCTAFIIKCANFLNDNDVLALVHQSTLWHLDSLSGARDSIQRIAPLHLSAKLGSRAFRHLAGEKASVSLSIFVKSKSNEFSQPHKYDFSNFNFAAKQSLLERLASEHKATITANNAPFASNVPKQWELASALGSSHQNGNYGIWAVPMQGTSTGNSREAVRYSWEIPEQYVEWVSASKGGGYSRWWGLNRYVVLWGKAGEELRRYPGHALRNVTMMDDTALVFSDTGTQGLNVRLRSSNQVFIASGPGIRINEGDTFAHLAFLNSRFASLVLRKTNPKLTIAAGYIKKLPFNEVLATHQINAQLAKKCVSAKKAMLDRKLSNDECDLQAIFRGPIVDFNHYFGSELLNDLFHEKQKLECEAEIDRNVLAALGISGTRLKNVTKQLGVTPMGLPKTALAITSEEVDRILSATLSTTCQFLGRSRPQSAFGIDGPLESMSYALTAHPQLVLDLISANIDSFIHTKAIFLNDLLHKAALFSMGFSQNRSWKENTIAIPKLSAAIFRLFPPASQALKEFDGMPSDIESWIRQILPELHRESYFNRPFLMVDSSKANLVRQSALI